MPLCLGTCIDDVLKKAEEVAKNMMNPELLTQAEVGQVEELHGYADLSIEADRDLQKAVGDAEDARGLAWFFTALGGLLLGDWKKLLTGSDSEPADA